MPAEEKGRAPPNAVESFFAGRKAAGNGKPQPASGTTAAIKALFRAAKAVLCLTDAPQPQARRRRGDTDKGAGAAHPTGLHRLAQTRAVARGRYAALRPVRVQEPHEPASAYAAATRASGATVSTATTLEWLMNMWEANSGMEDNGGLDDSLDTQQNHYYPQP